MSAANSSIYACSRTLMRLADEGSAPKVLGFVNKRGIPIFALLVSIVFGALAVGGGYAAGTSRVFNFLSNLIAICIMIAWMVMNVTHLRFRYGFLAQGRRLQDLPYVAPFFPYADLLSLTIGVVVTCFMLFGAFNSVFDLDWFMNNSWVYVSVPLCGMLFLSKACFTGFKLVRYDEMDFETGRLVETAEEMEENAHIRHRPRNGKEFFNFFLRN
ncbi:hypothetical protein HDU98_008314 [Podochytrium sp. JEL0797]|nr:hypothetical protein HDU98_008314 [Podochytrium sp. JEL0797]